MRSVAPMTPHIAEPCTAEPTAAEAANPAAGPAGPAADRAAAAIAGPRAVNPHLRRTILIVGEIVRAAAWMPLVIALIPLTLAFHLTVPAIAQAERAAARAAGATAPSGWRRARRSGEGAGRWLASRVTTPAFWRQDLPLCLGALLLTTVGFFLAFLGGALAFVLIALPVVADPERPVQIFLGHLHVVGTNAGDVWWTAPIGVAVLGLALTLLLGLGILRTRMVEALSGDREAERVEALTAQVGRLSAGRATLVDAFDAERTRIERDLHDGAQRELVALTMALGVTRLHAQSLDERGRTGELRASLLTDIDAVQDRAEEALRSLRETVRGIRPAVLTERGLAAALRDLAGRSPLPTTVAIRGSDADLGAISSPVATTVYFAVAEALTNAAKHAGPDARAAVELTCTAEGLSVVVADDGCGGADARASGSTGLRGMAQRVESVGGALAVDSPAGSGTRLTISAPLTPPWATDEGGADGAGGVGGAGLAAGRAQTRACPRTASSTCRKRSSSTGPGSSPPPATCPLTSWPGSTTA